MPRTITQLIYKCDEFCPYYDSLDSINFCIHPFNEYQELHGEEFSEDCPLEDIEKICYKNM